MPAAIRVTETIHHDQIHGATHADAGSLTEALRLVLENSPFPNAHRQEQSFLLALWNELLVNGHASRGWSEYTWRWIE